MSLGNHLFEARKKSGLLQEKVAEKLGVSRQTISKWETDETIPDIYQSKKLAKIYHLSLDELVEFDIEEKEAKIDWTNVWSKKYPVLAKYQKEVDIPRYAQQIRKLLDDLQKEYDFNALDSMLVLKDILYHEWKDNK